MEIHSCDSTGQVELKLLKPATMLEIPILLVLEFIETPAFQGMHRIGNINFLIDTVANHLWNSMILSTNLLRYEKVWNIRLMGKADHLYAHLVTLIRSFYAIVKQKIA